MKRKYPYNLSTRLVLLFYKFIWFIGLPFVVLYFLKRSIKEPSYRKHLLERFGFGGKVLEDPIWIHAVSLGEFRASVPLINEFLRRSEKIILTTLTPAGRQEANRILKFEIANGSVQVIYLPLEFDFAFNQFINRCKPRLAIILEIEIWPVLVSACSRNKIPLVLAQGQYVEKSFVLDKKIPWFRAALFNGFDLILAKSRFHAERYSLFCESPVEVMGELRFEQKIPKSHLKSAESFVRKTNFKAKSRLCFCFGSTGPGEDVMLSRLMHRLTVKAKELGIMKPFYIYVPRHENTFRKVQAVLDQSGLSFVNRSNIFDQHLNFNNQLQIDFAELDGIIGDSLGEINFYFKIADHIFIGNSFNNLGSHNVIEPLALKKPVVVGPSVWGIEYPIIEALEAGVINKVENIEEFYEYWLSILLSGEKFYANTLKQEQFFTKHSGAVHKCMKALEKYGHIENKI